MKARKRTMGSRRVSNGSLKSECERSCRVLTSVQLHTLTPKYMCEKMNTVDPGAKAMRAKSWPYYESCVDIFGKDRATGEHAVDPIDIVNDMMNHNIEQEGETRERCDTFTTENHGIDENTSVTQPSQASFKNSAKGKKM
ncbi:hypothetical protein ACS0TY_012078 [Phlomoides rotata]